MAWSYISVGMDLLINGLTFRYRAFKLDAHDRMRLANILELLKERNLITKDPVREKLWLGCQLIKKITTAIIVDAIDNGE